MPRLNGGWLRMAGDFDAVERLRAWRQQLDADMRAWYERNGHPAPEPLFRADEEVPCRLGCGTDLSGPGGERLSLLLADLDALLELVGEPRQEWGVQHPLFGVEHFLGCERAREACRMRNKAKPDAMPWRVVKRTCGEWEEDEDA